MFIWRLLRPLLSQLKATPLMGRLHLILREWMQRLAIPSSSTVNVLLSCRRDLIDIPVTSGNHTAIQSTFSSPCIPAHDTNATINGFDSGFRNTTPGTSGSILSVPIIEQNQNETFWFFDFNTCGQGGVGAINNNESSTETLAGFVVRDFASCRIDSTTLRRFGVSHTHVSLDFEHKHSFWLAPFFFPSVMPSA